MTPLNGELAISSVYDDLPAGICIFNFDEKMEIVDANNFFYQIFGYRGREEAKQAGFTYIGFFVDKKMKRGIYEELRKMISANADFIELDLDFPHKSGGLISVFSRCHYRAADGVVIANVVDITSRRKMQEELKLREKVYRLAVQLGGRSVLKYDVHTRVAEYTVSPDGSGGEQVFSLPDSPETEIATGLVSPESVDECRRFFGLMRQGKPSGVAILRIKRHPSVDFRWFKITFQMIYGGDGGPVYAIAAAEDITEIQEKEIALMRYRRSIADMPRGSITYYEFNLTRDVCEYMHGSRAEYIEVRVPDLEWDAMVKFAAERMVYHEDKPRVLAFLYRPHILGAYQEGRTEMSLDYRALDDCGCVRWSRVAITLSKRSYTSDVIAYCSFRYLDNDAAYVLQLKNTLKNVERELEDSRINVMMSQIRPHFLYNALSSIRTIILDDPKYASALLGDFITYLRASVTALSGMILIPFSDELASIRACMNIEQMRFGEKLSIIYEIGVDDFAIVPLSIQPIVENAVRHGIFQRGKAGGAVTVRTYDGGGAYIIEVIDDGVGFDFEKTLSTKSGSVGLKNIIYRLDAILHAEISFTSAIGLGTKGTVSIPKETHGAAENDDDEEDDEE